MGKEDKDSGPENIDPAGFDEFAVPTQVLKIKPQRTKSRPRLPSLRQLTGLGAPRELSWNFTRLVVGGGEGADFVVAASQLRDRHALFEEQAGQFRCESIDGSEIRLNGVKVHSCALAGGDRLDMGDVSFLFIE